MTIFNIRRLSDRHNQARQGKVEKYSTCKQRQPLIILCTRACSVVQVHYQTKTSNLLVPVHCLITGMSFRSTQKIVIHVHVDLAPVAMFSTQMTCRESVTLAEIYQSICQNGIQLSLASLDLRIKEGRNLSVDCLSLRRDNLLRTQLHVHVHRSTWIQLARLQSRARQLRSQSMYLGTDPLFSGSR